MKLRATILDYYHGDFIIDHDKSSSTKLKRGSIKLINLLERISPKVKTCMHIGSDIKWIHPLTRNTVAILADIDNINAIRNEEVIGILLSELKNTNKYLTYGTTGRDIDYFNITLQNFHSVPPTLNGDQKLRNNLHHRLISDEEYERVRNDPRIVDMIAEFDSAYNDPTGYEECPIDVTNIKDGHGFK